MQTRRRYSLSLTPENVKRFHTVCKEYNMPPGAMSAAVDDFLQGMAGIMEKAAAAKKFSFGDFLGYVSDEVKQMEKQNEEVLNNVQQVGTTEETARGGE